jgi:hydrogenase maturation protein HypF
MNTRVRAKILGRVQGVGFRPTVYRYATEFGLGGFVSNGPHGVTVEVEGDALKIGAFFDHLTNVPPPQAIITGIETEVLEQKGYKKFEVWESENNGDPAAYISPDLATCNDCLRELFDSNNRRHGYPFINCTNCGPRFTIIRALPYDRVNTSMSVFQMCAPCDREYRDPSQRRFHAQPNACDKCGPHLQLLIPDGTTTDDSTLAKTCELLRRGRIVAIKSLGGYHLACDATSGEAVARLRKRKNRPHKPLAVMFRDIETLRKHCFLNESEEAELLSVARPIVLLAKKIAAKGISPDTNTIGAFLPYTPLHHLLMQHFEALVMTSGNLTDEPIVSEETELSRLDGIADAVLTHNRPILHKCDDSVLRIVDGQRQFLRRARGFVPNPIEISQDSPHILAVGGELKNTFCLVRDGNAFVSQHIGDLKEYKTHEHFAREIDAWKNLMRVEPTVVVHDLHPAYLSTKFAQTSAAFSVKIGVQHHHAHIASVMAEHNLRKPVIGVALDGTGYGTDGTIWGGEFFVATRATYERIARFKPYPLPGGDKAVEEPWRMAASVLLTEGLCDVTPKFLPIQKMIEANFNSPLTSSAGRLFDAVAAILGLCDEASYEAQAAIRLEAVADSRTKGCYEFKINATQRPWTLDFGPMLRQIVHERREGVAIGEISAKFHNTIAAALAQVCGFIRHEQPINDVALSGGVFQNVLLLGRTRERLRERGFTAYTNIAVPPNDGGLSLGQAAIAVERLAQNRVAHSEEGSNACA